MERPRGPHALALYYIYEQNNNRPVQKNQKFLPFRFLLIPLRIHIQKNINQKIDSDLISPLEKELAMAWREPSMRILSSSSPLLFPSSDELEAADSLLLFSLLPVMATEACHSSSGSCFPNSPRYCYYCFEFNWGLISLGSVFLKRVLITPGYSRFMLSFKIARLIQWLNANLAL